VGTPPFELDVVRRQLILKMPFELRDGSWTEFGGDAIGKLRSRSLSGITLDFTRTTWADPLPLMHIGIALAEIRDRLPKVRIHIDLGVPRRADGNRFLLFLASQGFLELLTIGGTVGFARRTYAEGDLRELSRVLLATPGSPAFAAPDCIRASIISKDDLDNDLLSIVEEFVAEADSVGLRGWLPKSPRARGLALQKLRIVLSECLDNVREHAYPTTTGHAAIYARIRHGVPRNPSEQQRWDDVVRAERRECPGTRTRQFGKPPGWLEVYVSDLGIGIGASLRIKEKSPLRHISRSIFRDPLSSVAERPSRVKTKVTGFQHLGAILQAKGPLEPSDFVRLYSDGEWIGAHLPWPVASKESYENYQRKAGLHVPGTTLQAGIEPSGFSISEQRNLLPDTFLRPTFEQLGVIRGALETVATHLPDITASFVDLHGNDTLGSPPAREEISSWLRPLGTAIVIIRPARTTRKVDLRDQVSRLAEHNNEAIHTIVYADVPSALALDFAQVLEREQFDVTRASDLAIHVVTQDWLCASFLLHMGKLSPSNNAAAAFMGSSSAASTTLLLRERDSELFWLGATSSQVNAYFHESVIWKAAGSDQKREIVGYLDLASALAENQCVDAAKRAARRCLSSVVAEHVHVSDELAPSFVDNDFELFGLDPGIGVEESQAQDAPRRVLLSSVGMSGSTVQRFLARRSLRIAGRVQLLTHPNATPLGALNALLWQAPESEPRTPSRRFERIAGTPFVIRGGERSLPLPRFSEKLGGRSLYGESPDEAYLGWHRDGLLRLGHWVYGSHHDLLTLRVNEALIRDRRRGGQIIKWISERIEDWRREATAKGQGVVVVYAQHSTTDWIADELRRRQPQLEILPIHFVGGGARLPHLAAPASRQRLWDAYEKQFRRGGTVILMDDAIISGVTLRKLREHVEGLWAAKRRRVDKLEIKSIAIVDRGGSPSQRELVEEFVLSNPRYWRWDVPILGEAGSCRMCAALARVKDMTARLAGSSIVGRLREWEAVWAPVQTAYSGPDSGLHPSKLTKGDATRFGAERPKKPHSVRHFSSTSRAAIAAEITSATTRSDYALSKARDGTTKQGPLDIETRIEILASQCLLFWPTLSFDDRVDRLEVLLDLIWAQSQVSPHTSLAAICMLLDNSASTAAWAKCAELIEAHGFPNDDALICAYAAFRDGISEIPPGASRRSWALLRALVQPRDTLAGALGRLFSAIGWDEGSIHRGLLLDLLSSKRQLTANELSHVTHLMDILASAVERIDSDLVVGSASSVFPMQDAEFIRSALSKMREAVQPAQIGALLPYVSQSEFQRAEHLAQEEPSTLAEVNKELARSHAAIFVGEESIAARYRRVFSVSVIGDRLADQLLRDVRADLRANWLSVLIDKTDELRLRWKDKIPKILFAKGATRLARPVLVYRDILVYRALRELMANALHSSGPFPSPWSLSSTVQADMWARATLQPSGGAVLIEMVNMAPNGLDVVQVRRTQFGSHLVTVRGDYTVQRDGKFVQTRVLVPTVAGLVNVGGGDRV
jgi:hypothetical protein